MLTKASDLYKKGKKEFGWYFKINSINPDFRSVCGFLPNGQLYLSVYDSMCNRYAGNDKNKHSE